MSGGSLIPSGHVRYSGFQPFGHFIVGRPCNSSTAVAAKHSSLSLALTRTSCCFPLLRTVRHPSSEEYDPLYSFPAQSWTLILYRVGVLGGKCFERLLAMSYGSLSWSRPYNPTIARAWSTVRPPTAGSGFALTSEPSARLSITTSAARAFFMSRARSGTSRASRRWPVTSSTTG